MQPSRQRGVSTVIGIALLVAIVTILAGTIGVYLGSFAGATGEPVPNSVLRTSLDDRATPNGQYVNISHEGGEILETDNLRLDVDEAEQRSPSGSVSLESGVISAQLGDEWKTTETLSINRTVFVDAGGNDLTGSEYVSLEDATIRIIYERSPTETSILYECNVGSPDCTNREG